jgi:hypothetical protein
MNSYQKIVLILGTLILFITLILSDDISHSAFPMETLLKGLGIAVVMGLFLYAFKDLGKGKRKGKKK